MLRGVQVGGKAGGVLGVARRVHDGGRFGPGVGFAAALVAVILGLVVVKLGLVVHTAVAALHPDVHTVLSSGSLHGKKGIGGLGLQVLVDGGGRTAFFGGDGVAVRQLVGMVHQHHAGVIQQGLRLSGGQQTVFCVRASGRGLRCGRRCGGLRLLTERKGDASGHTAGQHGQAEQAAAMAASAAGCGMCAGGRPGRSGRTHNSKPSFQNG